MLFLNFGDNVLGRYTLRLRISRIINISLFSKIFLKSLGLLSTVLTTSNIAIMRSVFYSKKSWMNTHQKKKKKMKLLPVYYGQGKRTYENMGVLAEVSEKNRRSRRLDEIQES